MTKASQQASKTPLLQSQASMDSAGEVQSHVPGPLGGFCRLSATWKLLCTHPACHESTTSIHQNCTAHFLLHLLPLTLQYLHTSAHTNTHLCQQSATADKPSLSSYHTPARKLLAGACTTSTSFPASQCRSVPQLVTPILHQGYTLRQHSTPYGNLPARSTSQHSHGLHAPPLFIAAWQSPPQRAAPPTASRLQGRRSLSHKSLQDRHC